MCCSAQAARGEVTAMINSKKGAKQAELDKQYNDAKAKITRETEAAIAVLEKESQAMLAKLDGQVCCNEFVCLTVMVEEPEGKSRGLKQQLVSAGQTECCL